LKGLRIAFAAVLAFPLAAAAQATPPSSPDTAKKSAPQVPPLDFSGTLFANYQYRGDAGPAQSSNRFDVERVYLTFRIPAGERTSVRVTTDLFQQTTPGNDSYYRGWTVRAKYAYLQYNYLNGPDWKANARVGLLHTVFIDYDEQYWPRWVALSPTDRAAYFSSADAGIATTLSFPDKLGELYATITNGPGYTSRETDRFKDYAARVTITPWAANTTSMLKAVALTGWIYRGATASKFVDGGTGQIGRVGSALDRNRWGVHVGRIDPRFTFGAEYASRQEEGELGSNTVASPRSVVDSTGALVSGYGVLRPFNGEAGKPHPLSLIARYDRVTTNTDKDSRYNVFIGGAAWDLSSKASMSLDYQANEPVSGSPIARSHTWFAHFVARF
jgi:hypothetical protein